MHSPSEHVPLDAETGMILLPISSIEM